MKIQIVRRWALVAAGLALLCGLPHFPMLSGLGADGEVAA